MTSKATSKKPGKPGGIRAIARAQMNQEIKRIAWNELQENGASNLSLRAISREMNMTSSALYRYFKNRDALLTALIIDAYNDVGDRVEHNNNQIDPQNYRQRFVSIAHTITEWGQENPHRFNLVYGPPIPGYAAPSDTIDPGVRAQLTLYRLLIDWNENQSLAPFGDVPQLPARVDVQLQAAVKEVGIKASSHQVIAGMAIWSELMGTIYSYFFNHFGQELTNDVRINFWFVEQMATRIFGPDDNN